MLENVQETYANIKENKEQNTISKIWNFISNATTVSAIISKIGSIKEQILTSSYKRANDVVVKAHYWTIKLKRKTQTLDLYIISFILPKKLKQNT